MDTIILSQTQQIEQAWEAIKSACTEWDRAADDDADAERRHWEIVDAAESLIARNAVTSLRGAEIRLWVALHHSVSSRDEERAAVSENVAMLAALERTLDFIPRLIFAAIRDLRVQQEA